jgi:hypothetical protein
MLVGVCVYWCGGVGVVCILDCGVVVVGVVNGVWCDIGGGVGDLSIVVVGNWYIGGAVWVVWSIVVGSVGVVGVGGGEGGVLQRLLLPSESLGGLAPVSYQAISGSHLLVLSLVG